VYLINCTEFYISWLGTVAGLDFVERSNSNHFLSDCASWGL